MHFIFGSRPNWFRSADLDDWRSQMCVRSTASLHYLAVVCDDDQLHMLGAALGVSFMLQGKTDSTRLNFALFLWRTQLIEVSLKNLYKISQGPFCWESIWPLRHRGDVFTSLLNVPSINRSVCDWTSSSGFSIARKTHLIHSDVRCRRPFTLTAFGLPGHLIYSCERPTCLL